MVFFEIFRKIAQGEDVSAGEGIGEFFLLAFGGPALGLAFSIATLIILKVILFFNLYIKNFTIFKYKTYMLNRFSQEEQLFL